jgi:hypothetical protein
MALIDALMAGQQFVAGMQQQQQMAREYRDRMAMLARQEERAMRQEERQMMADFRTQEMQDFEMGLARSAEERAKEQFAREGVTSRLTNEQIRQSIEVDKLRIDELERQAANAATREEREAIEFELRERLTRLELSEAEAAQNARIARGEAAEEARKLTGKIYRQVGDMATAPEKINAKEFTDIRDEIVDLLESNSEAAPYLTNAIGMLSSVENRAMTTASPAYKSLGDRLGSLRRGLWGGPSIYDPKLGWFKKQEMPSMGDRWEMIKWAFTKPEERGKIEEGAFQTSTLSQMLTMGDPLIYSAMQQEGN